MSDMTAEIIFHTLNDGELSKPQLRRYGLQAVISIFFVMFTGCAFFNNTNQVDSDYKILLKEQVTQHKAGLKVPYRQVMQDFQTYGGVAGVQKLIGVKALNKLERAEGARVFKLAEKFLNTKGAAIAFQKNAWNSLRSENDSEYSIGVARAGSLNGTLNGYNDLWPCAVYRQPVWPGHAAGS